MSCDSVRDRLLQGESLAEMAEMTEMAQHLATCPECARFATRWAGAREALGERAPRSATEPHPAFSRRVVARLPGSTEELGRWAFRALPAALVLALALVWVGLAQVPLPATTLLAEEPSPEALLTYSVLTPGRAPAPPAPPTPTAEAPR